MSDKSFWNMLIERRASFWRLQHYFLTIGWKLEQQMTTQKEITFLLKTTAAVAVLLGIWLD
jgi:hypothetical protein